MIDVINKGHEADGAGNDRQAVRSLHEQHSTTCNEWMEQLQTRAKLGACILP